MSAAKTTPTGPSRPAASDAPSRVSAGLGAAVRAARAGRFTLAELAARANLSVGLLSLVERGRGNPSLSTLVRLAEALDLSLPQLLEAAGRVAEPAEAATTEAAGAPDPEARPPAADVDRETLASSTGPVVEIAAGGVSAADRWASSMTLHRGQEATVAVLAGSLELTLRDRTDALPGTEAAPPLSVDLSLRSIDGGPIPGLPELPGVDDPRWIDVVRGATPFQPRSLPAQMLFTHVVRCTREDPSTQTMQHWIGQLRGLLLTEPLPAVEIERIFGG